MDMNELVNKYVEGWKNDNDALKVKLDKYVRDNNLDMNEILNKVELIISSL